MNKIVIILTSFFLIFSNINAYTSEPHFIDLKFILNQSTAGKKAQDSLKKKLANGNSAIKSKEKTIQEEEAQIIKQKKVLSPEEYKKKVNELRKKVADIQKERKKLLDSIAIERSKSRSILLKNINPIMQDYMKKNNVRIIVDKNSVLLADEKLDITDEILNTLNKKLTSVK